MSAYAGDLNPQEAWEVLAGHPEAVLIDVRTAAEWQWVGTVDLSTLGKRLYGLEWMTSQGPNTDFIGQLRETGITEGNPVLFICRSGARSAAAAEAATAAGFEPAYNVAGGFEGDKDGAGHRGVVNGWKVAGLPWRQN